jgi:hypothetical protein
VIIDIFHVPIPEAHVWAVFFGWVAAYFAGRALVVGRF